MKHYYVSGVVVTKGHTRGFNVIEINENKEKIITTVWGNIVRDEFYLEARKDAQDIAEGLNLLEEKCNA